jgi:hypothetical protein
MAFSIFSSKQTTMSKSSKQTFRHDVETEEQAQRTTQELRKQGHQINGVIEGYQAPTSRRQEPSSVRKYTEYMGPAPYRGRQSH